MIAVLDLSTALAEFRGTRRLKRPVVTVGFFDSLHLGHQKILADLLGWASEVGGETVVITFDRQPREVLTKMPSNTITPLEQRLLFLARAGVQITLAIPFDHSLATWSPEDFVKRLLHEALGARELLLGFDSTIGRNRVGTFEYLKTREAQLGIEVRQSKPFFLEGARVSSTLVREAVKVGDLAKLEHLLGRPFSILGEVLHGERRGHELGFPTANLFLPRQSLPPRGVYFASGAVLDAPPKTLRREISHRLGTFVPAVVNLGIRPTFESRRNQELVEVHLLDFKGDIYGRHLEVHFLKRHRDEIRFQSPQELIQQIQRDILARREYGPLF